MNPYEILTNNQNYAVIGMHPNESTYAYKIYQLLKEKNKTVYGVNPNYEEAAGDKLYKKLKDINKPIDVAVFVVNPSIGIHMLDTVKAQNIKHVWLQPGTVNDDLLAKAKDLELDVTEACVLAVYAIQEPKK